LAEISPPPVRPVPADIVIGAFQSKLPEPSVVRNDLSVPEEVGRV